jgi:regulatory protein
MHNITKIKQAVFDENFAIIFLDGEFWVSIHKNEILNFQLAVNTKISPELKEEIEKVAETGKQMQLILNYNKHRPHSKLEIFGYLTVRKQIDKEIANTLITQAEEKGIVNDYEFAKWYAQSKLSNGKIGKNKVKFDLLKKGISQSSAEEVLAGLETTDESLLDETAEIRKLVQKFSAQIREENKIKKSQKIIWRLIQRGFELKKIKDVIRIEEADQM